MDEVEEQAKPQPETKKTKPALKYIKVTGYTNRAARRAQAKAQKKGNV